MAQRATPRKEMTLLSGATGAGNGTWIDVRGLRRWSVHVTGITNATVKIFVANTPTKPSDASDHIEIASMTSDSIVNVDMPVKWIKVKVAIYASGTINAYFWPTE